ncbi:structure-specific endonuclease subunit Slx4 [Pseudohyphozyma bogoriensis]|nr:structure-specific endonuclease subunit Slx4 [Pseudohyphozyma bogoriensis]
MDGDVSLDYICDSEPEREQELRRQQLSSTSTLRPSVSPAPALATSTPPSPFVQPRESQDEHEPVASTSTSRYFANDEKEEEKSILAPPAPIVESKRRRAKPWDSLASLPPPASPPPPSQSLSRQISLPHSRSTSASGSETKRTKKKPDDEGSPPKKMKREKGVASVSASSGSEAGWSSSAKGKAKGRREIPEGVATTGFRTASSFLREVGESGSEMDVDEEERSSSSRKPKPKVKKERKKKLKTDSSIEVISIASTTDASGDDDDDASPTRIDATAFHRLLHGLPPVKDEPASASKSKGRSKGKKGGQKVVVLSSTEEDDSDAALSPDLSPASKFRGGLDKFKYQVQGHSSSRSIGIPSVSYTSTSSASTTATSRTTLKLSQATLIPLDLPPTSHILVLPRCPLCSKSFGSKFSTTKATHLRTCAKEMDYGTNTVRVLTERVILEVAEERERKRREEENKRSLVERFVREGKEIVVVGDEVGGRDGGLEEEIEGLRKRRQVEKVVKVAEEIKEKQRKKAESEKKMRAKEAVEARVKKEAAGEEEEVEVLDDELALPRATGSLRPATESQRDALVERARGVLGGLGGTGLTQVPVEKDDEAREKRKASSALLKTLELLDQKYFGEHKDENTMEDKDGPPRSTQEFAPSKLAERLEKEGRVEIVSNTVVTQVARGTATSSLWDAQGGLDDEVIRRVVVSLSLCFFLGRG